METDAVISIPIQIAEYGVVSSRRQGQIGIGRNWSGLFDEGFQREQFRYPRTACTAAVNTCTAFRGRHSTLRREARRVRRMLCAVSKVSVRPTHLFAESWTRIMNQLQAVALNEGLRRIARFNALGHMESAQRCGRFGLASHLLRQVRSPSGSRMCVASH